MAKILAHDVAIELAALAELLDSSGEVAGHLDRAKLEIDTIKFHHAGTEDMAEVQLWCSPEGWNFYYPDEDEDA